MTSFGEIEIETGISHDVGSYITQNPIKYAQLKGLCSEFATVRMHKTIDTYTLYGKLQNNNVPKIYRIKRLKSIYEQFTNEIVSETKQFNPSKISQLFKSKGWNLEDGIYKFNITRLFVKKFTVYMRWISVVDGQVSLTGERNEVTYVCELLQEYDDSESSENNPVTSPKIQHSMTFKNILENNPGAVASPNIQNTSQNILGGNKIGTFFKNLRIAISKSSRKTDETATSSTNNPVTSPKIQNSMTSKNIFGGKTSSNNQNIVSSQNKLQNNQEKFTESVKVTEKEKIEDNLVQNNECLDSDESLDSDDIDIGRLEALEELDADLWSPGDLGPHSYLAKKEVDEVLLSIIHKEKTFKGVGIREYFLSNTEGKEKIKEIEENHDCNLEILSTENEKNETQQSKNLKSTTKLNIQFVSADIAEQQTDVIVISTKVGEFHPGEDSGIERAILKAAGDQLKNANPTKQKYAEGEMVSTGGYQLPCKEIYHVFLDYYSDKSKDLLQKAINKCLNAAEFKGYKSISFSCLGAGGFGFPIEVVATCLKNEIDSFQGKNLETVNVVALPQDDELLNVFVRILRTASVEMGGIKVVVNQGDITKSQSDAIVNTTGDSYSLSATAYSKAIIACTGLDTEKECKEHPIHSMPHCKITSGGNLCKYLFHLVVAKEKEVMIKSLISIFEKANELGLKSISLPAIGTGVLQLDVIEVAKRIYSAIEEFSKEMPTNLKTIKVVIYDKHLIDNFINELDPYVKQTLSQENVFEKIDLDKLSVRISAMNESSANKAFSDLKKHVREKFIVLSLADKSLNSKEIETEFKKEARKLEMEYNLKITFSGMNFTIQGLKSKIELAQPKLFRFLGICNEAIHMSDRIQWVYKEENEPNLIHFPMLCSANLEKKYNEDNPTSFVFEFQEKSGTGKVRRFESTIFKNSSNKFTARCLISNKAITIYRCETSNEFPSHWGKWDPDEKEEFKLVPVNQNSDEFTKTLKIYLDVELPILAAVKLERVENPTLYRQFIVQKGKVQLRLSNDGINLPVTRELFHGTSDDVCSTICKNGFDRNHAGKHATFFGKGVYFSATAKYSHRYAKPDTSGERKMFLCEVITGEYINGTKDTTVVPIKNNNVEYNSVVNDVNKPFIFVVFRDNSVYTNYLLTYK